MAGDGPVRMGGHLSESDHKGEENPSGAPPTRGNPQASRALPAWPFLQVSVRYLYKPFNSQLFLSFRKCSG